VDRVNPDVVRICRIGRKLTGENRATSAAAIEWNTPHGLRPDERADDSGIAFTGDHSLVEIAAVIQYRVRGIRQYMFQVRDPDTIFQAAAEGVLRETISKQPLLNRTAGATDGDEILTHGREVMERTIRNRLQIRIDQLGLGIEILDDGVCLQDVHPPLEVVDAFRDVSTAFKEKERKRNEAESFHRETVLRAGGKSAWEALSEGDAVVTSPMWKKLLPNLAGEAAAIIVGAESDSVRWREQAHGDAAAFLARENAQGQSPSLSRWRMTLETLEEVMPGKRKIVIDSKAAGRKHLIVGTPQSASASAAIPLLDPNRDLSPN